MNDDSIFIQKISKELKKDKFYRFIADYKIPITEFKLTSAKRLLKKKINIPKEFITNDDKIKVGDLFLGEMNHKKYHKYKLRKWIEKIEKAIGQSYLIDPAVRREIWVPDDIFNEVTKYFNLKDIPKNTFLCKEVIKGQKQVEYKGKHDPRPHRKTSC